MDHPYLLFLLSYYSSGTLYLLVRAHRGACVVARAAVAASAVAGAGAAGGQRHR